LDRSSEDPQQNVGKRKGDKEGNQRRGEKRLFEDIEEVSLDQEKYNEEKEE
jgi:hypothetical protein